jgi:hypothetical protein
MLEKHRLMAISRTRCLRNIGALLGKGQQER